MIQFGPVHGWQNESNGPITAPMMSEMLAANQPVMVDDTNIINVWRDNLEQAFKDIAEIVQTVSDFAMQRPASYTDCCDQSARPQPAESR